MERAQAIAAIEERLPELDDAQVRAIAEIAQSMGQRLRPLTPEEQESLEQAREDFVAGRTMTHEELVAALNASPALTRLPKIGS